MSDPINVLISGRLVSGHPMDRQGMTAKQNGQSIETPVMDLATGLQKTEAYCAVAVPKAGSVDWKQTTWGQLIHQKGVADFPNGEHGAPTFAWKITDGDSQVPNQNGKKPCDREGWAGHWVVHCKTGFAVACHHPGIYEPINQIQDPKEIKTGDYCRVNLSVRGNAPSQSPGVYLNPTLFELSRAGDPIIVQIGPSASEVFGGVASQVQQPQVQQPQVQQPQVQQPQVQPATDLVAGPGQGPAAPEIQQVKYIDAAGNAFTKEEMLAAGCTEEMLATMPTTLA